MNDLKEKGSPNAKKNIQALANIMIKTNTLVDFNAWYIRKSSDEMKRLFKSINERIQEKNA